MLQQREIWRLSAFYFTRYRCAPVAQAFSALSRPVVVKVSRWLPSRSEPVASS
jgi:hypothetical protein